MRKKKICFFNCFFPETPGGSEYQTYLLAKSLDYKKYDIFFLSLHPTKHGVYCEEGINVYYFNRKNRRTYFDKGYFLNRSYIESVLKNESPDVVYQRMGNSATWILQRLSKKLGYKFVWACASDETLRSRGISIFSSLRKLPEYLLMKHGITHADAILVQTEYQKKQLKKICNRKGVVLKNGHPVPVNKTKKAAGVIKIIWIANFNRLKQPELFIRLANHFKDYNNVSFVMIGGASSGNWQLRLEEEINKHDNLEYLGFLPQECVNDCLSESHILVNTSIYEGFSNTFIQAWLHGVPVVSLNVNPDGILSNMGLGFCSGNFKCLCHHINLLINNRSMRKEMKRKTQAYAIEHHSISKIGRQFDEIIQEIVSSK